MNMSDLSDYIHNAPLIDTHEHLKFEEEWLQEGPDVLQDIFGNYIIADLVVAGASQDDVDNLLDINSGDIVLVGVTTINQSKNFSQTYSRYIAIKVD